MGTWYNLTLENKSTIKAKPRFVVSKLMYSYNPFTSNEWKIRNPNNWLGTGSGIIKRLGPKMYQFIDDKDKPRVQLKIIFPSDCEPPEGDEAWRTGWGMFLSPFKPGKWLKLEWSNRNIIPDE